MKAAGINVSYCHRTNREGYKAGALAEGEARYSPIGYHVGTVWPFDNSFIAWGLRRYGFREEAARIAAGIAGGAAVVSDSSGAGRIPEQRAS